MNITTLVSSTVKVNASIIKLTFTVTAENENVAEAIKELNTTRKELKTFLFGKNSFTSSTYNQTNITTTKKYKYISIKKTENNEEKEYKDQVFDKYVVSSLITCELKNSASIIEDFTDILKFITAANNIELKYTFDITDEERVNATNQLVADIIDNGMQNIRQIIEKSGELVNMKPILLRVEEPQITAARTGAVKGRSLADFMEELEELDEVITPELVADIFDNKKIVLSKSLNLTIDIKSPKALN